MCLLFIISGCNSSSKWHLLRHSTAAWSVLKECYTINPLEFNSGTSPQRRCYCQISLSLSDSFRAHLGGGRSHWPLPPGRATAVLWCRLHPPSRGESHIPDSGGQTHWWKHEIWLDVIGWCFSLSPMEPCCKWAFSRGLLSLAQMSRPSAHRVTGERKGQTPSGARVRMYLRVNHTGKPSVDTLVSCSAP